MEIKEILENLGYGPITESGEYLRMRPLYRDSDNNNVLSVNRKTGYWKDFKLSESGSIGSLIQKTLGLENIIDAYEFLEKEFQFSPKSVIHIPKIKVVKKFSEDFVKSLKKDSSYWLGRGISQEVIDQFEGGVHTKTNRYYFIIRNQENQIIGLCGRILGDGKLRYLIRGEKSKFDYPLNFNYLHILEKGEVILVEGIPDAMSLFTCGIKTPLVLFGVDLSNELVTTLIKLDINRIILAFNNDNLTTGAGNIASEKVKNRLNRYFDSRQIKIALPPTKDLNLLLQEKGKNGIKEWYGSIS